MRQRLHYIVGHREEKETVGSRTNERYITRVFEPVGWGGGAPLLIDVY